MDVQFHGGNCLVFSNKSSRIVIDYDPKVITKNVLKPEDVSLYTTLGMKDDVSRLVFNSPGEYEIGDISIIGIEARSHIDENTNVTMYRLSTPDVSMLVTGHIFEDLNEYQLEKIGSIDVLFIPVGNNGYTIDPLGALKVIKDIEPKIVIPTHYAQSGLHYPVEQIALDKVISEMAMEPSQTVNKLKVKRSDLAETTQLVVLESI